MKAADSPGAGFVAELRRAAIPNLAAAYLVAAWLTFQAADLLMPRLGWSERAVQAVLAALIACFPLALIVTVLRALGKGVFRSHRGALAGSGIAAVLVFFTLAGWVWRQAPPPRSAGADRPLVLMMDSPHPARVYDPETLSHNGTNADVVSDILLDLPIRRQKETIGPYWHRDEEMRNFAPELILIHWSGFCQEDCDPDRVRLRQFLEFFRDTETRFLIYSRQPTDSLSARVDRMLKSIPGFDSETGARVYTFALDSARGIPPFWRSPVTANELKLKVRRILNID